MYQILLKLHNVLAWLVLGTGFSVLVKALGARATWSVPETAWGRRLTLLVHLQLVAGLALWFVSPWVNTGREVMAQTMKDATLRRIVVEHPTLMLVAVITATVTSVLVRKAGSSEAKAQKALVGTAVTLLLVAAMVPWQLLTGRWTS